MSRITLLLLTLGLASCSFGVSVGRNGEKLFSLSVDPVAVKHYLWPDKKEQPTPTQAGGKNAIPVTP